MTRNNMSNKVNTGPSRATESTDIGLATDANLAELLGTAVASTDSRSEFAFGAEV